MTGRVLSVEFFHRPAAEVARDLLGAVVVSQVGGQVTSGQIVETEAYLGFEDPASHAWRGRKNARNASLFAPPGSWYVYRSYGIHWCANLVCEPEGIGAAVLLRALEPMDGVGTMIDRRSGLRDVQRLCDGPGKLCQALGITRALDGSSMWGSAVLAISGRPVHDSEVLVTPRIGITKAADWPLRWVARKAMGRSAHPPPSTASKP